MTRVMLVNPPSPEALGTPLMGLQYVAAALLERGCEVAVLDAAARHGEREPDVLLEHATAFAPDIVGFGLFTRWVWHAYQLAERFAGRFPLLVAGGAHATVRPVETLERGFDVALVGEVERSIVALVDWVEGVRARDDVPGAVWRSEDGTVRATAAAPALEELDVLAPPLRAQHLFDPAWYDPAATTVIPGGILTSRGCPAHCTFCANHVTGRRFRHRSAEAVVAEVRGYHDLCGVTFLPCWDDALTANRKRLYALCDAFERELDFPFTWSAITRANLVTPELLAAMRRAGLVHVNFGVESGDDDVLKAIKKGIKTDHVVRALEQAKAAGLSTACNFMVGFPQETPAALERTLRFMERIAPLVDTFSTLGVLVPYPGTPLYDDFHREYGFTDWWLRREYATYRPYPPMSDVPAFRRHYVDDANLELDFFRYSPEHRELIRACLRFKGEHNLRRMGLLEDPVFHPEPVAP
jgi:radical SAM superfamily enzyme YgiQ (UPF0313 family)